MPLAVLVIKGVELQVKEVELSSNFPLAVEAAEAKEAALADADGRSAASWAGSCRKLCPGMRADVESPQVAGAVLRSARHPAWTKNVP